MDDFIKDIIYEATKKKCISWSKVNSGDGLHTHFKVLLEDGLFFLCKIMELSKERLGIYKSIIDRNIACFQNPAYIWPLAAEKYVVLLPWIVGNKVVRNDISAAAEAIRDVHSVTVGTSTMCISKKEVEKNFENNRDLIDAEYFDILLNYVIEHLDYLNGRNISVIHGDLHLRNMLGTSKGIRFIDIDDCKYGDPYMDLVYASNLIKDEKDNPLYYDFLMSYFNHSIPKEFWIIANIYSIHKALSIMRFEKEHTSNHQSIYKFENFMTQHKMMSCDVPLWFEDLKEKDTK